MARIQKMRTTAPVREIRVRPLDSNKVASIERRTEDIRQMIVPATLEVGANHILSQNRESTYLRTLYVHDYPRDVEGNWLKDVLNLDFNLDVSLHIRPLDPQHARRRLDANERELTGTLGAVADDAPTARDLTERLEDIAYSKEDFRQKAKWFQFALYFMPYANSLENLDRASKAIEDRLAGLQFRTQRAIYRQEQGLNSVLPQATDRLQHTRGISTRPLPAAFPFNSADQIEAGGYLFGIVGRDDTPKSLLVLNPRTWDNPHLLVLRGAGHGKTHNPQEKGLTEWI